MSEYVTDEMVEKAAKVGFAAAAVNAAKEYELGQPVTWDGDLTDWDRTHEHLRARMALEAVAPLIAAKALRDAANELRRLDDGRTGGYYDAGRHIIKRLDARADEIEGEQR